MRHQRIVVSRYGGPDALQLIEEDVPEPKAGEVRVKVLAAGVSMPDVMAREGIHPETPRVPYLRLQMPRESGCSGPVWRRRSDGAFGTR